MQKQTSIDDQINECRRFILHKNWELDSDQIYCDSAASGADADRAGYQALKEFASQRAFEYIVVDDLSRLGRNAGESIQIFQEFAAFGIGIVSISDGIETLSQSAKIPYYFKSIANELFLDELKSKIVRGLKGQVRRGYSAGGRIYGYDPVPVLFESREHDKFGRPRRYGVRMQINEHEAAVVQRIFDLKSTGVGYRAIAHSLNEDGTPSPHAGNGSRSGAWCSGTVKAILGNSKYIGDWTWNKTKWFKKNITGKRIKRDNPSDKWIEHQDESLRIIPQQLWNEVQSRSEGHSREQKKKLGGRRAVHALSEVLVCSECNGSLIVHGSKKYSAYICNNYWNKGKAVCDCGHRLNKTVAEESVFTRVSSILSQQQALDYILATANEKLKRAIPRRMETRNSLTKREAKLRTSIDNLLDVAERGGLSESLRERLARHENELRDVQEQLAALPSVAKQSDQINIAFVRKELSDLCAVFANHPDAAIDRSQAMKLMFPEKLIVRTVKKAGKVVFKISGKIMPLNAIPVSEFPLMLNSGAGTCSTFGFFIPFEVTVTSKRGAA